MKLSTNEVVFLRKYFEDLSPISLMANLGTVLNGTEELSLMEKGIIIEGKLDPGAEAVLETLAYPTTCSRMVLTNNFCLIEKYAYKLEQQRVLVENSDGLLEVSVLEDEAPIQMELSQWVGASNVKTADCSIALSYSEVLPFFALVDFYRGVGLRSYLGEVAQKNSATSKQLVQLMENPMPNSLVRAMQKNYGMPPATLGETEIALKKLAERGVVSDLNGFELTSDYQLFAENFLIPDTLLMLETLNLLKDGSIKAANSLAFGAGLRDWIGLTFGSEDVDLETLTSVQLLQSVALYLGCPET